LTQKEKDLYNLTIKLCQDNIITASRRLFKELDTLEIDALASKNVFKFIQYNENQYNKLWIFKIRMV